MDKQPCDLLAGSQSSLTTRPKSTTQIGFVPQKNTMACPGCIKLGLFRKNPLSASPGATQLASFRKMRRAVFHSCAFVARSSLAAFGFVPQKSTRPYTLCLAIKSAGGLLLIPTCPGCIKLGSFRKDPLRASPGTTQLASFRKMRGAEVFHSCVFVCIRGQIFFGTVWLRSAKIDPPLHLMLRNKIRPVPPFCLLPQPNSPWQKSGQAECLPHQLCKLLNLLRWRRRFRLRLGSQRLLPRAAKLLSP